MGPLVLLKTINILLVHLCLAGQSFAWPRKTLIDTEQDTNSEQLSKGQSPSELIEMDSISVLCVAMPLRDISGRSTLRSRR